jgi:hypothetical protein
VIDSIGIGLEIDMVELRGYVMDVHRLKDGKVCFIIEWFHTGCPLTLLEVVVQYAKLPLGWKL